MKEVQFSAPILIGDITIRPMVRIQVDRTDTDTGFYFYACREPVGILIETPEHKWALDLEGAEIPLDLIGGETWVL